MKGFMRNHPSGIDMEIMEFAQNLFAETVQYFAGYRIGQTVLHYVDRVFWVLEKTARWAVPPPLDQDERPQPELVRPLPWIFFFWLLIMLRITRESISIINLFRGKPPLRSADVVMYIQSKRRSLRALKYQGSRNMRNRQQAQTGRDDSWISKVRSMMELTMCFRRPQQYGVNNNDGSGSDEVLIVNHHKRPQTQGSVADSTMERLIEKMMVDMNSDTDDDTSYTVTTVPSLISDSDETELVGPEQDVSKVATSTPTKSSGDDTTPQNSPANETSNNVSNTEDALITQHTNSADTKQSPKRETENLIEAENQVSPKKQKMANGQAVKNAPKRKKGGNRSERRDSDVPEVRVTPADDTNNTSNDAINRVQHYNK